MTAKRAKLKVISLLLETKKVACDNNTIFTLKLGDQTFVRLTQLIIVVNLPPAACRGTLRKDNSYKDWSKGIIFTFFKRRQITCCFKNRDFWKVKNTWNGDQSNLIQKIQQTFQCITSTKCTGRKRSKPKTQNVLKIANPENFSSIE